MRIGDSLANLSCCIRLSQLQKSLEQKHRCAELHYLGREIPSVCEALVPDISLSDKYVVHDVNSIAFVALLVVFFPALSISKM